MDTSQAGRPLAAMAIAVEAGIDIFNAQGLPAAVSFLIAHHVPDRVIGRVLCEPDLRRGVIPT